MPRKNLILGLFSHMPFQLLEPFVASLQRTTFCGDVCVFVSDVAIETIAMMQAHGIRVERSDRLPLPAMHAQSSRYFAYLDFLTRNGKDYDHVMLSDLRDVVFQADPFAQPLPADIVFAQERCLIGEDPINCNWIADAYSRAIADNLRDCLVSCSGTTFGTVQGMLRYLAAMTTELAGLVGSDALQMRGIDQGIHNYLIRMRPLCNAWLDTTDSIVATMQFVPDRSVAIAEEGVQIDGKLVPVLHQWDRNPATREHVSTSPRFRLASAPPPRPAIGVRGNALLAYYHGPRDAGWLEPYLASLRGTGFVGNAHCIGIFDPAEQVILARYSCTAHPLQPIEPAPDIDNGSHLALSSVLDRLAEDAATAPEQVLVMDSVRATFLRDPFLSATIGLSVFHESATRIGDSDFNRQRVELFTVPDEPLLRQPIISSSLLRGRLDLVRAFYRKLLAEYIGRAELLRTYKSIQGAINKVCHAAAPDMAIIQHPNGAEVYLETGGADLPVSTVPPIRIAGAVPFAVINPTHETELMRAVRASLGLAQPLVTPQVG